VDHLFQGVSSLSRLRLLADVDSDLIWELLFYFSFRFLSGKSKGLLFGDRWRWICSDLGELHFWSYFDVSFFLFGGGPG